MPQRLEVPCLKALSTSNKLIFPGSMLLQMIKKKKKMAYLTSGHLYIYPYRIIPLYLASFSSLFSRFPLLEVFASTQLPATYKHLTIL